MATGRFRLQRQVAAVLLPVHGAPRRLRRRGAVPPGRPLAAARRLAGTGRGRPRQPRRRARRVHRRRHRDPGLPARHQSDRSARLDLLELHRLPGQVGLACLSGHRANARPGRPDLWVRPAAVRVHHRDQRPLRLDRGNDGAALLDQRVHGHDRRRPVRVLDDDAVSLSRPSRVLTPGRNLEPGLVPELPHLQPRRRDPTSPVRRCALLPRRLAAGRGRRQEGPRDSSRSRRPRASLARSTRQR